jgi:mono/diheme cytochrome c family protein
MLKNLSGSLQLKPLIMGYLKNKRNSAIAASCIIMLSLASCDRTRNQKGYEYFPDMAHSLAYETYAPNRNFASGSNHLVPVPGSVPREMIPYRYPATPEGRMQAGKELVNPVEATPGALAVGKVQFTRYCSNCHGESGKGDGHLYTSGKFPVPPASLVNDRMKSAPVGEVFHVITVGQNVMGAHGSLIQPENRWKIALYIKNVLQSKSN